MSPVPEDNAEHTGQGLSSPMRSAKTFLQEERCDMGDLHWVISLILGTIVASMLMLANKIKEH
ncbi:hypothetical protein LptCag_0706 [Leptospirillum ferriphilum]|jgi:hypothetical protein|uniref:Uncharacterized protein n=4 Tax=Leptospirillum TaxID=179 RepID=A0A094WC90_9BACT|nr:hypothetical protein LptCag_0706 [Leptospirillum ferriphilum]